ncbi:MAG: METTL5 family protein [Candidatus Hodarchaeota archaeon]
MSTIPKPSYRLIVPQKIWLNSRELDLYNEITSFVNKIDGFISPKVHLEQYSLPSDLIALILVLSTKDLIGNNIVDLGCGTGRFTLPIKKFLANNVLGVDIDLNAVKFIIESQKWTNLELNLLITAIEFLESSKWKKKYHTTITNPPFGTKRRKLDIVFLKQALKYSQTVLSIHKSNSRTRELIKKLGSQYNKELTILATVEFSLPPSLHFHRKRDYFIRVDVIRLGL